MSVEKIFYVGSYTEQGGYFPKIHGEGLSVWSLNMDTGNLLRQTVYEDITNSTYLAKLDDNILLVASDGYFNPGNVLSYKIEDDYSLHKLSSQSTFGTATCHVSVSKDIRHRVFVTSYLDSKLSVHDLVDGNVMPAQFIYQFIGNGPNKDRQEHSHAHCAVVSPNGRWLYVCDLGSDRIWLLDTKNITGEQSNLTGIEVPAGYGPRHITFSKEHSKAYLICELNAHILTYDYDANTGTLNLIDDCPTLPEGYTGLPSAAAIRMHPSGTSLYISNRNHNTISVFSMGPNTGKLHFESRFSTMGDEPRDFNIDPSGKWLVCANQNSDTLVTFELDINTGLPKHEHQTMVACGTPVNILF